MTVTAATPLLDTQSGDVGNVVSGPRCEAAARDSQLGRPAVRLPGVQGDRYTEQAGSTAAGRTGGVNVHGDRSLQNNFMLDGVDNNSISRTSRS